MRETERSLRRPREQGAQAWASAGDQAHAYMAGNQHFGKIMLAVDRSVMAEGVTSTCSQVATKEFA